MSAHADRILQAIEGGDDTSTLATSWRRCHALHGVDPDRCVAPERDGRAWRESVARNARLVEVARPYLDQLYRLLGDADCGVFLADSDALLLDLRTNRTHDSWHRAPDHWLGTVYSERLPGTNGIGTCLVEERAVVIRAEEHYLARYAARACIGAPLFGPDGTIIGCLAINQDAAAYDARLDAFLSISVASLARRIEIEMFARAHPDARLMLASDSGRRPDALLAVDPDSCVVGATRAARRLLDLGDGAVAGRISLDEIYATRARRAGAELAAVERRAIERALAQAGGNLSAAARAMGISRSTLYRKLATYEAARDPTHVGQGADGDETGATRPAASLGSGSSKSGAA